MKQTTTIFALRCAQQQAQLLAEMLGGVLELLEAQPDKPEVCQHPMKSRSDLSTFNRTKWTCRECGYVEYQPGTPEINPDGEYPPIPGSLPPIPKPPTLPWITFKEGEIPQRHSIAGNFS